MKKTLLFTILAASLVFTGCAALQNGLNGFVNGLRGTGTNVIDSAATAVKAPL